MSSPQLENGYIKIANDIYDAFCRTRISGEERQILDCILRKTYGWNKCEDAISISQFADMTGIQKPHIIRAIKGLLAKNIISVANIGNSIAKNGNDKIKVYKFIKDYTIWRPLPKKATLPKMVMGVAKNGNPSLPKMVTTKDTTTKDTITKDIEGEKRKRFVPPSPEEVKIYCLERNNNINPQTFIDFYQANGWMIGKNKMKDWKAGIRTWEGRQQGGNGNARTTTNFRDKHSSGLSPEQEREADAINAEYYRRKALEAANKTTGNT